MKKILALSILSIFVVLFSVGMANAVCTYTSGVRTDNLSKVLVGTQQSINVPELQVISSIYNITPVNNFNITVCEYSFRARNSSNQSLNWYYVYDKKAGVHKVFNVTNSSGYIVGQGNYTVYTTDGIIRFSLSANAFKFNNTLLTICFVKEVRKNRDNLVSNKVLKVPSGSLGLITTGTYGYDTSVGIIDSGLTYYINNTKWYFQAKYTNETADCVVTADACRSTQRTIYAAFGLIAIMAVAVAAFFIISMFTKGEMSMGLTAGVSVIFGIIAGTVILFIGYVIINALGIGICGA